MKKHNKDKKNTPHKLRGIDHLVMSVDDLAVSEREFARLGFSLNEKARHNFGTENTIIPFSDGTFIEPLAIGHRETVEQAMGQRNLFVLRDHAFRFRRITPETRHGFSMISLTGQNAQSDKKIFKKSGLRTGKLVTVKRPGLRVRASFALDENCQDISIFSCERKKGLKPNSSYDNYHPNGALGIERIIMVETLPSDFQYYLQSATGQRDVYSDSFKMEVGLTNGSIAVYTPQGLAAFYGGIATRQSDVGGASSANINCPRNGLRTVGVEIKIHSFDHCRSWFEHHNVAYEVVANKLVVPIQGSGDNFVAMVE